MKKLSREIRDHLVCKIIPFWQKLKDVKYGGYYSYVDYDQALDKEAPKGCILNSRILWFFSAAYVATGDKKLLDDAKWAYDFLMESCIDKTYGGIFWQVKYNGECDDDIKHTYNQAFAIYALSAYYEASGEKRALDTAFALFQCIEEKCRDCDGYLEAFTRDFSPMLNNEKLSENGTNAFRTMNTLLHVLEGYTELYRVSKNDLVREKLYGIVDIFEKHVFNAELRRQELFFDKDYNTLADVHSYGHDIETAWLLTRCAEVIGDADLMKRVRRMAEVFEQRIYERAFVNSSILNECENGVDNLTRVWWMQAEAIVGFANAYRYTGDEKYKAASHDIWEYIKEYFIDKREGSEWFWSVSADGTPDKKPIVEPWKCPYHNGRMCIEIIRE